MRAALASLGAAVLLLAGASPARATDFYEIQIYTVNTAPQGHLMVELHANALGANVELDYMRRAAVDDPLALEMMPITEARLGRWTVIGNLTFGKQFSGPGTHNGVGFEPSGAINYRLLEWLEPSVEYFGDIGPISNPHAISEQQQFIVPAFNLYLVPQLEFNVGVGFGLTRSSNGTFVASTIGWEF